MQMLHKKVNNFIEKVTLDKLQTNPHYYQRLIKLLQYATTFKAFSEWTKPTFSGLENHHVIPRSWNGIDHTSNLVTIPSKMHYIIHHLMWKSFPHEPKMAYAFYMMIHSSRYDKKISAREYDRLQKTHTKIFVNNVKGMVSVRFNDGTTGMIPKQEYDKNSPDYKRPTHGKVMAFDIETDKNVLVERNEYYSNLDRYIAVGVGNKLSDERKEKLRKATKEFIKTGIQRVHTG